MHDMCIESEFEFLRLRVEVIDNLWDFSHHWDFSLEFKIERILLWKERTDHIDGFWKEEDFFFFFLGRNMQLPYLERGSWHEDFEDSWFWKIRKGVKSFRFATTIKRLDREVGFFEDLMHWIRKEALLK